MVGSGVVVKRGVSVAVGVKVEMGVAVAAFTATCGVERFSSESENEKTLHPTEKDNKIKPINNLIGLRSSFPLRGF